MCYLNVELNTFNIPDSFKIFDKKQRLIQIMIKKGLRNSK